MNIMTTYNITVEYTPVNIDITKLSIEDWDNIEFNKYLEELGRKYNMEDWGLGILPLEFKEGFDMNFTIKDEVIKSFMKDLVDYMNSLINNKIINKYNIKWYHNVEGEVRVYNIYNDKTIDYYSFMNG